LWRLGQSYREVAFRMHRIVEEDYRLHVSFEDNQLILVTLEHLRLPHPSSTLLSALGKPAARLDYQRDINLYPEAEWVFPDRGISVFTDSPGHKILHVALFQACSIEHYTLQLKEDMEWREQPAPEE